MTYDFHRIGIEYDAVVVGAGLSGLISGGLLAKSGLSVLIVESHSRVGGRLRGVDYGGNFLEPNRLLISSAVGTEHTIIKAAKRLNCFKWETYLPKEIGIYICKAEKRDADYISRTHFAGSAYAVDKILDLADARSGQSTPDKVKAEIKALIDEICSTSDDEWRTTLRQTTVKDWVVQRSSNPHVWQWFEDFWFREQRQYWERMGTGYLRYLAESINGDLKLWFALPSFEHVAKCFAEAAEKHGADIVTDTQVKKLNIANGVIEGVTIAHREELWGCIKIRSPAVVNSVPMHFAIQPQSPNQPPLIDPRRLPYDWLQTIMAWQKNLQLHYSYWILLKKEIVPPYPEPRGTIGTLYADDDLCPDWPPRTGPGKSSSSGRRGISDITCPTKIPGMNKFYPEGKSVIRGGFPLGSDFNRYWLHGPGNLNEALLKQYLASKACCEKVFPEIKESNIIESETHYYDPIAMGHETENPWPGGELDYTVPTIKGLYLTGSHVKAFGERPGNSGMAAMTGMKVAETILNSHRKG